MALRVPKYETSVTADVPRVQNAPEIPHLDLSGGLSAINKMSEANQNLGETVSKIGLQIGKHAKEQQELKNEQVGAQVYTSYARDMQNKTRAARACGDRQSIS